MTGMGKRGRIRLAVVAALAAALALGACTTTGGSIGVAAGSSRLAGPVDDYTRTVREGAVGGALIGAAVGGLIGAATGGDTRRVLAGIGIGALAGGLIGTAAGVSTAEAKQRQIVRENALDGQIRQARGGNAQLRRIAATAEQLAAQRRAEARRLSSLADASDDARARRSQFQAELAADRAQLVRAISAAEREGRELQDANAALGRSAPAALRAERDENRRLLSRLRTSEARLAAAGGR